MPNDGVSHQAGLRQLGGKSVDEKGARLGNNHFIHMVIADLSLAPSALEIGIGVAIRTLHRCPLSSPMARHRQNSGSFQRHDFLA